MDKKPREFWLDDISNIYGPWDDSPRGIKTMPWPDSEKVIHVIEISALRERDEVIAELMGAIAKTNNTVAQSELHQAAYKARERMKEWGWWQEPKDKDE